MSLAAGVGRAMLATSAGGRGLPGCVAKPPEHVTRYRGADHVRCTHPTPVAEGFNQCEGDSACQFRLRGRHYCPYHEDLVYDLDPHRLYEELTGLPSATRITARSPWA